MRSVTKSPGGKRLISKQIVSLFPEHTSYHEPFFGSGACLLRKSPSPIEVASDADVGLMNAWTMIRDEPGRLSRLVAALPYEADQFEFVVNRMSRGAMGEEFANPAAGASRLRGGIPDNINSWKTLPDTIMEVSPRLGDVMFVPLPFDRVVSDHQINNINVCIYLDPPYLPSTRTARDTFRREMTGADHMAMLLRIRHAKAAIFLSGYPSAMYSEMLPGWHCFKIVVPNSSGQNRVKQSRIECVWSNRPLGPNRIVDVAKTDDRGDSIPTGRQEIENSEEDWLDI